MGVCQFSRVPTTMERIDGHKSRLTRHLTGRLAALAICTSVLSVSLLAQQSTQNSTMVRDASDQPKHLGYPQDWSARHLLLTGTDSTSALRAGVHEPRHVYNLVRRLVAEQNVRRGIEDH